MDMQALKDWECFDSDTGEDLAVEVREYHIPDFSQWEQSDERPISKVLSGCCGICGLIDSFTTRS